MHRGRHQMLFITEREYNDYSDEMKGRVNSEYMEEGLHRSFLWNRVLIIAKIMYIEGLNMVITKGKRSSTPRLKPGA